MIDKFEQFENEIIKNIIQKSPQYSKELDKQYKSSRIVERKFTEYGFYTTFKIQDEGFRFSNNINLELGDVQVSLDGLKYGMGFVLFVRNGLIKSLEGYTYEEYWDKTISNYFIE